MQRKTNDNCLSMHVGIGVWFMDESNTLSKAGKFFNDCQSLKLIPLTCLIKIYKSSICK